MARPATNVVKHPLRTNSLRWAIDTYREALDQLEAFLADEAHSLVLEDMTRTDIGRFLAHLRDTPDGLGRPRSDNTIANRARSLRAFFHWQAHRDRGAVLERSPK